MTKLDDSELAELRQLTILEQSLQLTSAPDQNRLAELRKKDTKKPAKKAAAKKATLAKKSVAKKVTPAKKVSSGKTK